MSIKEKFLLYQIRARREPEAFGKLYDLYADRIYRFIYFKVSSKEEAQDITSEVFLKAWEYLNGGQPVKHLSAFLYRIARNLVIDFYRLKAKQQEDLFSDNFLEQSDHAELLKRIEIRADVKSVYKVLAQLKEEYREVLMLKYVDELSSKEISEVLQKNESNVRVLLHRATHELRSVIATPLHWID